MKRRPVPHPPLLRPPLLRRQSPRRLRSSPHEGVSFAGREILVGVTGGIAAYKVADLVSKTRAAASPRVGGDDAGGAKVHRPDDVRSLTNRPVLISMYAPKEHPFGEHIGLARRADLYLIAPPARIHSPSWRAVFAGDLVSILALTMTKPVLVAPAMNNEMWSKPAVARNVRQLRDDGVHLIERDSGWLSCGGSAPGRMADVDSILATVAARLPPSNP